MKIELNKIYNMDCLEGMKLIKDNSVDLIIADPPYGINYQSNFKKDKFDKLENDNIVFLDWIDEAYRILKPEGALYCYTRWDVYDIWFNKIKQNYKIKNIIIWYKKGGGLGDLKGSYIFNHEFIIYAVKGRHILNGKRENDVWEISKGNTSKYIHPTQKPIELAEKIINKSSDDGGVVLVPFVGSGNDIIGCINADRNYIGFELDENYYKISKNRINGHISNLQMA